MSNLSIKEAVQKLSVSKSNLYSKLKKLGIKPIKIWNRSYVLDSDIDSIKLLIDDNKTTVRSVQKKSDTSDSRKQKKKTQISLKNVYKNQIEELKEELKKKEKENKDLILKCGRWEWVAQTLKDQNSKILSSIDLINSTQQEEKHPSFLKRVIRYFH